MNDESHEHINISMETDRQDNLETKLLHLTVANGHTDLAALIISKGADINCRTHDKNQTVLHLAAEKGQTDMTALIISKGADINSQDNNDSTALHLAAEEGHTDVAALLITKGADINIQDNYERTALDIAKGKAKILLQLIESGVNFGNATQAIEHCNTFADAQKYAQTLSLDVIVPSEDGQRNMKPTRHDGESDLPPDGGAQQLDQDVILPGIVDAVEFKSLLKQGTYDSYGNRVYLAGACSVGKTTLASLLIGEEIPVLWKSTDGLQIYFGRNGIHLEERKMIPLDKHKGNKNIFSNVLRGKPVIDKIQPAIAKSQPKGLAMAKSAEYIDFQPQDISMSRDLESTKGETLAVAVAQSMSYVPEKQLILKEKMKMPHEEKPMQKLQILGFLSIHEDIKNELKKGEYKIKIAPSDLVDFGGQRSYDMTHQLFIQGKGTFTLLFDGRKGLRDLLTEYPQGNVTSESILKHWVESIMTYCGEDDDDILPVILFVATHRDALKEDEQSKMMTNFKQGLKEIFQYHERKTRIKYDDIFFINGTDRDDPEVVRLQTTYVNIAFKQKSWGRPMPMAWVPLELQMAEMRSSNISIISKDDLITLNKQNDDLAITDRQLDEFLRVQHSLGHILYIEEQGLADYVIVKPTTLVDILRSFITDEMFWPSDETLKGILKAMTETGKIKKKDLLKIWSQEEFNQHMPDYDLKVFVAQTLTYLDLLVEPKHNNRGENVSDFYLVPCMVKRQINANLNENIDKMISLSYLLKSTIPSALSFKLIGAAKGDR